MTIFGTSLISFVWFSFDFSDVRGVVRDVAVWTLPEDSCLPDLAAIDADPRRHKLILNERPWSSLCALSHTVLLLLQTTTT